MPRTSKRQVHADHGAAAQKLVTKIVNQLTAASLTVTDELLTDILSKTIAKIPNDSLKSLMEGNMDQYLAELKAAIAPKEDVSSTSTPKRFYVHNSSSRVYTKTYALNAENGCLSVEQIVSSLTAAHIDVTHLAQTLLQHKSILTAPAATSLAQRIMAIVMLQNNTDASILFLLAFAITRLTTITASNVVSMVASLSNINIYQLLGYLTFWVIDNKRIAEIVTNLLVFTNMPPAAADIAYVLLAMQWASQECPSLENALAKHFASPSAVHKLIVESLGLALDLPKKTLTSKVFIVQCLRCDDILPACRKFLLNSIAPHTAVDAIEEEPVVSFVIDGVSQGARIDALDTTEGALDSQIAASSSILASLGDFGKDEIATETPKKKSKRAVEEVVVETSVEEEMVAPIASATKKTRKSKRLKEQ